MKCQYFGCTQEATVRIPSVNMVVCDEHYALNVVRFGCEFKFEVLNKERLIMGHQVIPRPCGMSDDPGRPYRSGDMGRFAQPDSAR